MSYEYFTGILMGIIFTVSFLKIKKEEIKRDELKKKLKKYIERMENCDCPGCSMINGYQPCHKQKPLGKPPN